MIFYIKLADTEEKLHAYSKNSKTLCGLNLKGVQYEHIYHEDYNAFCKDCREHRSFSPVVDPDYFGFIVSGKKAIRVLEVNHCLFKILNNERRLLFQLDNALSLEDTFVNFFDSDSFSFTPLQQKNVLIEYDLEGRPTSNKVSWEDVRNTLLSFKEYLFEELQERRN